MTKNNITVPKNFKAGIDTAELVYCIKTPDAEYVVVALSRIEPTRTKQLKDFVNSYDGRRKFGYPIYPGKKLGIPGLLAVYMYRNPFKLDEYYLCISINLEWLCCGEQTVRLYRPSQINNDVLQDKYAEAIMKLFPKALNKKFITLKNYPSGLQRVPYLGFARVREVGISINFEVNDSVKELTLEMTGKSFYDSYKKKCHVFEDGNYNIEYSNGSSSFCIYDKRKKYEKYQNRYTGKYGDECRGVVRFEFTKKKLDKGWLSSKFGYKFKKGDSYMGLLPFLDSDRIDKLLYKYCVDTIGTADWYSDYKWGKRIKEACQSDKEIEAMELAGYVFSQSRGVAAGIWNMKQPGGYKLNYIPKTVQYTDVGSGSVLNMYRNIRLQPLRIPTNRKKSHVKNLLNDEAAFVGLCHAKTIGIPGLDAFVYFYYKSIVAYLNRINVRQAA